MKVQLDFIPPLACRLCPWRCFITEKCRRGYYCRLFPGTQIPEYFRGGRLEKCKQKESEDTHEKV